MFEKFPSLPDLKDILAKNWYERGHNIKCKYTLPILLLRAKKS